MATVPQIDGYSDLSPVARGGFGAVFQARQDRFDRVVALKVLTVEVLDEQGRDRFERECRAMGNLSWHPNVVAVHDSGITEDGHPYLAMEYLDAGSLADRLTAGPLPWQDAVSASIQVAGALGAAHAAGTLHRDLKPENILVGPFGEAKLGDFGIAAVDGGTRTATGHASYTVTHVAPEVLMGERPDVRSDVYGLGSTLHTLLAAKPPFAGDADEAIGPLITRVLHAPPPRLDGVPPELADLVQQSIAKDPAERPPTAEDFGRRLQAVQTSAGVDVTELRLARTASALGAAAALATTGNDPSATIITKPGSATSPPPGADATIHTGPGSTPPAEAVAAASPAPPPPPAAPPPEAAATPEKKKGRGKLIAAVVGIIAVLAIIGAVLATSGGDSDEPQASSTGSPTSEATTATTSAASATTQAGSVTPSAGANTVTETIDVGGEAVGVTATDTDVWTIDAAGIVTHIDPATDEATGTFDASTPLLQATPSNDSVWAATAFSVLRIDDDDTLGASADDGFEPSALAALDDDIWVAATNVATGDGEVLRVKSSDGTIRQRIPVGADPAGIAAADISVWVSQGDDTVGRVDVATNQSIFDVAVGSSPGPIAATVDHVWVVNVGDATVSHIDPNANAVNFTVDVGGDLTAIAATADAVWVTSDDGTVSRIDPSTQAVTATIDVGGDLTGIAATDRHVWVTARDGTVSDIDPG